MFWSDAVDLLIMFVLVSLTTCSKVRLFFPLPSFFACPCLISYTPVTFTLLAYLMVGTKSTDGTNLESLNLSTSSIDEVPLLDWFANESPDCVSIRSFFGTELVLRVVILGRFLSFNSAMAGV